MVLRLSLFAALMLGLAGCGPTTLKCDDICTPNSATAICPASTQCLETSTANVNRCLPSTCSTCPIGKCAFDVATDGACSNVMCEP